MKHWDFKMLTNWMKTSPFIYGEIIFLNTKNRLYELEIECMK